MENSYTLTFEDRNGYLFASLTGQDSFAASLSYWNEIADKVGGLGYRKLLVHENLLGEVSESEIFDVIADLKDSGLFGVQIAFYDENHADAQINNLGQLVANNRGAEFRIFQSMEAAQHWIEQDD